MSPEDDGNKPPELPLRGINMTPPSIEPKSPGIRNCLPDLDMTQPSIESKSPHIRNFFPDLVTSPTSIEPKSPRNGFPKFSTQQVDKDRLNRNNVMNRSFHGFTGQSENEFANYKSRRNKVSLCGSSANEQHSNSLENLNSPGHVSKQVSLFIVIF